MKEEDPVKGHLVIEDKLKEKDLMEKKNHIIFYKCNNFGHITRNCRVPIE